MKNKTVITLLAAALAVLSPCAFATTLSTTLSGYEGFGLETEVDLPDATPESSITRVAVLVHGSGAQGMHEDLTSVSAGVKNLFFDDVSAALVKKGFAVIRYNKRNFQINKMAAKTPSILKSELLAKFTSNPLLYFVEDAKAAAQFAAQRFPAAKVYMIGHSEGTNVALQAAAQSTSTVSGVALIGFYCGSLDNVLLEQTVYRPLYIFDQLDANKDGALDANELAADNPAAKSISRQMSAIDLNHDGKLEKSEFMAANYTHVIMDFNDSMRAYRKQEASYPTQADIIKNADFKIAFFQGELDNQTPAYYAKSIELINRAVWQKENLSFHFFDGLGHALDKRSSDVDLVFKPADQTALSDMASELDDFWK
jgi:pimeloyl-ACP methyl ester carboxylesterase